MAQGLGIPATESKLVGKITCDCGGPDEGRTGDRALGTGKGATEGWAVPGCMDLGAEAG